MNELVKTQSTMSPALVARVVNAMGGSALRGMTALQNESTLHVQGYFIRPAVTESGEEVESIVLLCEEGDYSFSSYRIKNVVQALQTLIPDCWEENPVILRIVKVPAPKGQTYQVSFLGRKANAASTSRSKSSKPKGE